MAAITDNILSRTGRGRGLRPSFWAKQVARFGDLLLPKGLYARALLIIIAPIVLLQSVLVFVFMERHHEFVTRRLATATVQDIAMLAELYEAYPTEEGIERLTDIAREKLNLVAQIEPGAQLPPALPKPFFRFLDRTLSKQIRSKIDKPFWIDTVGDSDHVEVRVKLSDAVLKVLARRSQTYSSNTHIFLLWMITTSLILLTVAILFLRNQIRPVLALAQAAESFGRGHPAPADFKVRGAREVRQAAHAFIEMRDRIERHVEQRTTMLAGVSHDLRTVLTRFRLQLAMMDRSAENDALVADVDEMQQMLEDYLAFAKGGSSERPETGDVAVILEDIAAAFQASSGRKIMLVVSEKPLPAMLRRNAFKRAISNLVSNATRFGKRIAITVKKSRRNLIITVEDDGPGVPAEARETVFRPFHSLDSARNQNVKSTGLGLAIARDIIRAHGGEIHLGESQMGGLKATIRMPY
jgi:two-component system, OmpR family, osmolarity sensor histidine kinase EnvZ